MGIIDTTKYTVTCPNCGLMENVSVHQKGSAYNAYWQDGAEMQRFDTKWIGGGKEEPKIQRATCRTCGAFAEVA
jgi:transcription elongation factor Elf1